MSLIPAFGIGVWNVWILQVIFFIVLSAPNFLMSKEAKERTNRATQSIPLSKTQKIIAHESGVANTVDPLGGSYYIEWLTNQIEEGAQKNIEKIDEMGGVVEAIKKGYIQKEIMRSAYNYQKAVDSGEEVVIGVNKFATEEQ